MAHRGHFLILGVLSMVKANPAAKDSKALLLEGRLDRFLLGAAKSALNPAQIPFWFVWSGYFMDMYWLASDFNEFNGLLRRGLWYPGRTGRLYIWRKLAGFKNENE